MTRLSLLLMLALAVTAFASGPIFYRDHYDSTVSAEAIRRLKTQLAVPYKVRPRHLQVVEARMAGSTPDHVEGSAVWRTLFGIPVGTPRHTQMNPHYDLNLQKWLMVWIGFLIVEGLLVTGMVWHLRRE